MWAQRLALFLRVCGAVSAVGAGLAFAQPFPAPAGIADCTEALNISVQVYGKLPPAQVVSYMEHAHQLCREQRGPDHPDTLRTMSNLALSYSALGRGAEALMLSEETLALRRTKLGPDHPGTLSSMNNLANSYSALGRTAEALKLGEETLALRRTKLGPDHPDTLASMGELANSYSALGRSAEALKLGEETLALMRTKLGQIGRAHV